MGDIDNATAKAVGDRVMVLIASVIKQEFGLNVRARGGTYAPNNMTLRFEFNKPHNELTPKSTSNEALHFGLAVPGTLVLVTGRPFTIVKSRRTKYVIADATGKEYLINFKGVTAR